MGDARLRIGVVGCGQISQAHAVALRMVAEDGLVAPVAAADPDPAGLDRFDRLVGGVDRRYGDGHELIADPDVDAVVVVTPTRFHRDLVLAVAAAGKPLFTEKPLAPTYPVVREIVDGVRAAGIPNQVGFQSRQHPLVRHARRLVTGGDLGAPLGYSMRDDQFWPTGGVVPGHSSWRSVREEAGGGALLEHSIHSCDILVWLFGPVRRVYASTRSVFGYDVEDIAALTVEHASGVIGSLVTAFNGVQHREERRLEVFLEQATMEVTTDFLVGAPEDSFLVHRGAEKEADVLDVGTLRREAFASDGFDPDRVVHVYQYFAHHAFASAVRDGRAPTPDVDDALAAHRVVEAAYRSAARGAPVELAELD